MIARKKRQLIMIVLIIIIIVIIAGLIIALYLTTDMFKPKNKLFQKYLAQNLDTIDKISNLDATEITDALNNQKLSEELKATLSYRDNNNNMSNTVNKAEVDISGQTCKKENYNYQEARMVFENADISKFEYLQDGEDYGIRLEGIEQFISAKNENLNDLETLTGIPKNKLELITLMFNPLKLSDFISFTPDELKVISSTYSSIIEQNTDAKNFKQKSNQNIEIDGNNYIVNAYVLEQNEEQLNSLIIALLERIEKDEIILGKLDTLQSKFEVYGAYKSDKNLRTLFINSIDAKIEEIKNNNIGQEKTEIAVYVKKGQTIKTTIKNSKEEITIDTLNNELIQVNYTQNLDNKTEKHNIRIKRDVTSNSQDINIEYTNSTDDTENKKLTMQLTQNKENEKISSDYDLAYTVEGNKAELKSNQYITCVDEFENQIKFSDANNVSLNNLNQEQATKIVEIAKNNITNMERNILEKVKLEDINTMLKDLLILKESEIKFENTQEEVVTEAERNRFNSQLTFFIGKEVDVTNVNQLLDTIQDCFSDAQIFYDEEKNSDPKPLKGMILDIKRKTSNQEKTSEIKEVLEGNNNLKFTIAMSFDENTKLINKITIVSNDYLKQ